jgi:DNA phosphorothioation-associated putative methyltransferase
LSFARHRTAIRRSALSRPVRLALQHEILGPSSTFFDYGCGRGDDIAHLTELGIPASGWDPTHFPDSNPKKADVVNLGYVVNVIERPSERDEVVAEAWRLTRQVLIVSARLEDERDEAHVRPVGDGWATSHGTFQKFFDHTELGMWIQSTLRRQPVAGGPGVYYVFRDERSRETFLASRFRRQLALPRNRPSDEAYRANKAALDPLMDFVEAHGRLPHEDELDVADELLTEFGSMKRAFRIVLWVTDEEAWSRIRRERAIDLLVHLGLANFHGRLKWSQLPISMQRDIRSLLTNYSAACTQADRLLFATGDPAAISLAARASTVGKLTPSALYVHASAIADVPAILRLYEGCAQAVVGTVDGANLIKLHRDEPKVSYLSYPDFDADPHPRLHQALTCDLRQRDYRLTTYATRENPPILHRKESFVPATYPRRSTFERLTTQEERFGLYEDASRIGTLLGWQAVLEDRGVEIRGHRVVRRASTDTAPE